MNPELPVGDSPVPLGATPPERLPTAAWGLAAASLTGQLVWMADAGLRPENPGIVPSMLIGALVVSWFAAGVLTARSVRVVLTWLLFVIMAVGNLVVVLGEGLDGLVGWPGVHLLTALAQLAAMAWFTGTPYYDWQRLHPRTGPSRAPVIACAALVGLLGGVAATHDQDADDGNGVHIRIGG